MTYTEFVERRRSNPKAFSSDTIRSFQYLQDLANMTRVNLDTWDMGLFSDTSELAFTLIQDKIKINEIFFAEVDRRAKENKIGPEIKKIIPEVDAAKYKKDVLDLAERTARASAQTHERAAINYAQSYEASVELAIREYNKADAISGSGKDITARLNDILTLGIWEYSRINGAYVCFRPVADIWLTYRNAATQEHYRVNFGKLEAHLGPQSGKILVYADRDGRSPNYSGYWHPHVNNAGNVCLGDAADAFTKAMTRSEFKLAFEMLFNLLTHYNPDSPYVQLKKFQELQPENKPGFVPRLCETCSGDLDLGRCDCCGICNKSINNCECFSCSVCQTTFKKEDGRCDCCQECGHCDCVCCVICNLPPNEDGEIECDCCHYCGEIECKCEACPGKMRDGSPCNRKITLCGMICSCKKHHLSRARYCEDCDPDAWKQEQDIEQERRRIDGERQRQEEQAEVARQLTHRHAIDRALGSFEAEPATVIINDDTPFQGG